MTDEFKYQLSIRFGPLVGAVGPKGDRREPAAMLNVRAADAQGFHDALEAVKGPEYEALILDVVKKYGNALVTAGSFPPPPQFNQSAPPEAEDAAPQTPRLNEERLSVQFLDAKPSPRGGTMWTAKFGNGVRAGTFDAKHGAVLEDAKRRGSDVYVSFVQKGQYTNIGTVRLA